MATFIAQYIVLILVSSVTLGVLISQNKNFVTDDWPFSNSTFAILAFGFPVLIFSVVRLLVSLAFLGWDTWSLYRHEDRHPGIHIKYCSFVLTVISALFFVSGVIARNVSFESYGYYVLSRSAGMMVLSIIYCSVFGKLEERVYTRYFT